MMLLLVVIIISLQALLTSNADIVTIDQTPQPAPQSINELIDNTMSSFESLKTLDRDIETFMRRWELRGGTFAIMRNDSLLYAKGYGDANEYVKCDASHIFRIASVSKLITATAIMKLSEEGRLSLDDQVFGEEGILCDSMFLSLNGKTHKLITVDHLLRHTAGFSSPYGDPAFANYGISRFLERDLPLTTDDMVLYATRNKLRARPGDRYDYSNLGYIILGKIVERVSEVSYESYVRDSIMFPIGCYDMHIARNYRKDRPENEVSYFEVKEAEKVEAFDGSGDMVMKSDGGNNVTLLGGAGGWVTSSVELLRFVAAINGCPTEPDILSANSIKTMTYDSSREKPIGWATVHGSEWLRSGSMAGTSALIKKQSNGYTWVFISNSSAWIGPHITNYISSQISKAVGKVKEWPERNLFDVRDSDSFSLNGVVPVNYDML